MKKKEVQAVRNSLIESVYSQVIGRFGEWD
jgi:hypothetical protein